MSIEGDEGASEGESVRASYAIPASRVWNRLWLMLLIVGLMSLASSERTAAAPDVHWATLGEGLAIGVWDPKEICQDDVVPAVLVKVDPMRFRFATFYFRKEGLSEPPTIVEWQQRTAASIMFNAGQFLDDYTYMGLLLKEGRSIGGKRHRSWHGLFVADPFVSGIKPAGILDLTLDNFSEERPLYREAAQSLMLLDRHGKPRVRRSGKQAQQTVVGELKDGTIVLIKTMGESALWDLAECIKTGLPEVRQALALDGGSSSDVLISGEVLKNFKGVLDIAPWSAVVDGSRQRHIPLPSVIGIFPRNQ